MEIREEVGEDHFFLFGLTTPEVEELRGQGYRPGDFIARSPRLREAIEAIEAGFFSPADASRYRDVTEYLRHDDPFMACADFDAYVDAEALAAQAFTDRRSWSRSALRNIAGSARFSSDETVRRYAEEIWKVRPIDVDMSRLRE